MILLIEGYKYKADDVKDVLEGLGLLENLNQEVIVNYVGYMYNPHIKDCVFMAQGGLSVAGRCRCLTKDSNTSIEKEGYIPYSLQA